MVSYVVRTTSSRPLEALSKVDSLVVPWKRPVLKWPHVSSSSLQLNMTEPGLTTRKVPVSGLTFSYLKQKKIKWRVTRDVTKLDTSKYIMAFFFFFCKKANRSIEKYVILWTLLWDKESNQQTQRYNLSFDTSNSDLRHTLSYRELTGELGHWLG